MKTDWQTLKLGDVCDFQRGLTYSKGDEVDFSGNIVLRATNINLKTNTLDFSELKYIRNDLKVASDKKVHKGSVIICTASGSKSHLGKVALIDDDYNYAFGGFMAQITPKKEIESKYLFYCLTSDNYRGLIDGLSDGVNINNLKYDDLKDFEIPVPPLSEQKRIVKILDEVFENVEKAKGNTKNNLENSKEFFDSYSQNVFASTGKDWEDKTLGEIAGFSQGIQVGLEKHLTEPKEGYVRFIRIIDYTQNTDDVRYIPNPGDKYFVNEDDVVMVRYGTPGLIGRGKAGVIANNLFKIIIKRKDISNDYLSLYLSQKNIQNYLSTRGSSTMPALNFGQLKTIKIKFPPLSEQKAIVKKLDALSGQTKKLEDVYKQKLTDLEELKKSVLNKAFTGEL